MFFDLSRMVVGSFSYFLVDRKWRGRSQARISTSCISQNSEFLLILSRMLTLIDYSLNHRYVYELLLNTFVLTYNRTQWIFSWSHKTDENYHNTKSLSLFVQSTMASRAAHIWDCQMRKWVLYAEKKRVSLPKRFNKGELCRKNIPMLSLLPNEIVLWWYFTNKLLLLNWLPQ